MNDDVFAAKFAHRFFHTILGGVIFEGLVDVGVGWRITANKTAEPWDNPLQVLKINPSPRREAGFAEIEHEHFAAGLGEAMHFAQAVFKTGEIAQTKGNGDTIKMIIGQAGFQRVAFAKGDGEIAIAADGLVEHRFAEIEADYVRAIPREGESDVAGAAAKIESALVGAGISKGNEAFFPVPMEAEALQIVDEIVAGGNGVKEVAHTLGACCIIGKITLGHRGEG